MKNIKAIISSLFLLMFIFVSVIFLFNNKNQTDNATKNNEFIGGVQSSANCASEGETIGASGMPSECCSDLKAVGGWPGGYNGDCMLPPPPTGLTICAKCGDGKCDTNTGENKCNCKEDCE